MQFEDVARRIVAGDGAAGLHRHAGMAADRSSSSTTACGGGERRVDVAIALAHHGGLGRMAGIEFAGRRVGREQRRQFFDFDRDQIGGILGEIGIGREHDRDRLADIAHALAAPGSAGGRDRALRCGSGGNRSAECRRRRPRSTPRRRPAARAPRSASIDTMRPCACGERTTRMCS